MVVLNSRDRYENVWFRKICALKNNLLKITTQNPTTTLLVQH